VRASGTISTTRPPIRVSTELSTTVYEGTTARRGFSPWVPQYRFDRGQVRATSTPAPVDPHTSRRIPQWSTVTRGLSHHKEHGHFPRSSRVAGCGVPIADPGFEPSNRTAYSRGVSRFTRGHLAALEFRRRAWRTCAPKNGSLPPDRVGPCDRLQRVRLANGDTDRATVAITRLK
jgi:hypothetical protein